MLFGRKKKDQPERPATIKDALAQETDAEVEITEAPVTEGETMIAEDEPLAASADPSAGSGDAPENADASGQNPTDLSEIPSKKGYLDFGAILIPASKNQKVRLDIDQKTKRIVSLTIAVEKSSIQLQAFSAPKSGGIWDDVRHQIEESVVKQKGRVKHVDGRFGKELHARVPTVLKDGRQGWRAARFIGFEGGRWFLRGVIGGRGAIDREAAAGVEDLFSRIVVSRGEEPLPPRELLKLNPPAGAKRVVVPRRGATAEQQGESTAQSRANGVPPTAQNSPQQKLDAEAPDA